MKFLAFDHAGHAHLAVLDGEVAAILPEEFGDLVDIAVAGPAILDRIRSVLPSAPRLPLEDMKLLAPLARFRRDILCTGWNYAEHFDESVGQRGKYEVERPSAPTFFTKGPDTVIGPRDNIAYDTRISSRWDYEAELALVIGRTLRSASPAEAEAAVFGYCLANDISQRDLQRRHGGQWLKGKSIDGTMPIGPFVVTADEFDPGSARLECFVNGELRQSARIAQMAFPIGELLAELSFGMTLRPGDLVLTGTPSGIGSARKPPVFLKEGDEVVVRGTGLGEQRNRLVTTNLAGASVIRPLDFEQA